MSLLARRQHSPESPPVRIVGRGLRARRGVRLTMRGIREGVGKTQDEVAAKSQMDQADISRIESRDEFGDCQVSTLQRYLRALGGSLELVAAFGNKRIVLCGVEAGLAAPAAANETRRTAHGKRGVRHR